MVHDGLLELVEVRSPEFGRVRQLMEKYRDLPMDFADAVLTRVAERDGFTRILTFDRHFEVYRLPGGKRFTVLPASRPKRT